MAGRGPMYTQRLHKAGGGMDWGAGEQNVLHMWNLSQQRTGGTAGTWLASTPPRRSLPPWAVSHVGSACPWGEKGGP